MEVEAPPCQENHYEELVIIRDPDGEVSSYNPYPFDTAGVYEDISRISVEYLGDEWENGSYTNSSWLGRAVK